MPAKVIFDAPLGADFEASEPFLITADRVVLDWIIEVSGEALAKVDWYLELASDDPNDPATDWFREAVEQNNGTDGNVPMPLAIRTWRQNDGTLLPAGTYKPAALLTRSHQFARVQVRAAQGVATVKIFAPFGGDTISP